MNVFTEVLNGKTDTTCIVMHDDYYSYFNCYGAFKNIDNLPEVIPANTYFYRSRFLQFGDYDNSCAVERANVREFKELYKDLKGKAWHSVTGGYNSESIYIDITCTDAGTIETLNNLFNYPAINDETVSEIESEIESEYWESVYKSEFLDAIKKKFDGWDIECKDDQKLWELYRELSDKSNTYFEVEAGGIGYIKIERLIDELTEIPDFIEIEVND